MMQDHHGSVELPQMHEWLAPSVQIDELRSLLRNSGVVLLPQVLPQSMVDQLIHWIDSYEGQDTEVNYGGSELRIWNCELKQPLMRDFFDKSGQLLGLLVDHTVAPKTLLAIRNRPIDLNDSSLSLGRWHLDSFFEQFKVFVFLTETTEDQGPFEFVPQSHKELFKYRMLLRGEYLKPLDLVSKERTYQRLRESFVAGLGSKGMKSQPVICPAGTIMVVNTSAIHRARPCKTGSRYALTAYFE